MILSLWDEINKFAQKVNNFIDKNADNYLFWIALAAILFAIAVFAIRKLADK